MTEDDCGLGAIPGRLRNKAKGHPENNRLAPVFNALVELGVHAARPVHHAETIIHFRHAKGGSIIVECVYV